MTAASGDEPASTPVDEVVQEAERLAEVYARKLADLEGRYAELARTREECSAALERVAELELQLELKSLLISELQELLENRQTALARLEARIERHERDLERRRLLLCARKGAPETTSPDRGSLCGSGKDTYPP